MTTNETNPNLVIYYHSPCSDGHAAAWAIKAHLGQLDKYSSQEAYHIQYIPSAPGCQQIDLSLFDTLGGEAWFLDLMPSYDMLRELCARCSKVVVLDHHKTNLDIAGRIHPEDLGIGGWAANLELVFDMTRAGCQIAWDWITAQIPQPDNFGASEYQTRPWFLEYVADRDLWTWRLPNSKLINTALFGLKLTITPDAIAEKLAPIRTDTDQERFITQELMPYALAAEEFNNDLLRTACNKATECQLVLPRKDGESNTATYRVWLGTTIGSLRSDLGNQLCNKPFLDGKLPDLAAIWHYEFSADEWWISLRCLANSWIDVSAIAKEFGGGGHRCAAGFTLKAPVNSNITNIFKKTEINNSLCK